MRTLRAIIAAQTNDEVMLSRDFVGFIRKSDMSVPGAGEPEDRYQRVTVQVAMENTAVVYTDVTAKFLVKLERVWVRDEDVGWCPMNPTQLREMRSRHLGQLRGKQNPSRVG